MRCALLLLIAACHHGAKPASEPSCANVSEHVYGMLPQNDHGKSVRDVFVARCAKDDWSPETRTCMLDVKTLHDGHHCKDHLSPEQRSAFEIDLEAIEKKRASATPPECERYRLVVTRLSGCDKMAAATRDATKQAFDMEMQGWSNYATMDQDQKRVVAIGCKVHAEALEQTGKVICGW